MQAVGTILRRRSAVQLLMECGDVTVNGLEVVTRRRRLQWPREVLVDAAGDVPVEVLEQHASVAQPHGAGGLWRWVHGPSSWVHRPSSLQRLVFLVTRCVNRYVHSWLVGVSVDVARLTCRCWFLRLAQPWPLQYSKLLQATCWQTIHALQAMSVLN